MFRLLSESNFKDKEETQSRRSAFVICSLGKDLTPGVRPFASGRNCTPRVAHAAPSAKKMAGESGESCAINGLSGRQPE